MNDKEREALVKEFIAINRKPIRQLRLGPRPAEVFVLTITILEDMLTWLIKEKGWKPKEDKEREIYFFHAGLKEGIRRYAWEELGTAYVGAAYCGVGVSRETLDSAIKKAKEEEQKDKEEKRTDRDS